ncbi:MAG TPA: TonB-dependent receptor [Pyrinomonadaceae bacterium]|nr:TonB-dependent receptor [Pyrinomonadaceae bacterium]
MKKVTRLSLFFVALLALLASPVLAQVTGSISGEIKDEKQAVVTGATVTVRNVKTNESRNTQTDGDGRYRFNGMPVGDYEITVESTGFAKYVQSGITLVLNQQATVDATLKTGQVSEVVNIVENASILNTATTEVGTRFDSRRLSELPIAPNRNVYAVALSAPGVSQLQSNQAGFTNGINYSSNGGRLRSNNFLLDGQDNNDFGVGGGVVQLNNPDLIQEVRLVTNQFSAEYGRNSSSVFNAITKSGSNQYHGSAFWFHNDNHLNACSNLNKNGGFCNKSATDPSRQIAPFRVENQAGMTFGGPLHLPTFGEGGPSYISGKDRTFFFFALQRWWDRRFQQGQTIQGVPTTAGRAILQQQVGNRPQVQALLEFLPPAQSPNGQTRSFFVNGQEFVVPLGSLTGSSPFVFNDWQQSIKIDHHLNSNHTLSGRYIYQDADTIGAGQVTPSDYESSNVSRNQGVNVALNSILSPKWVNELRLAYLRAASATVASDLRAEAIPSIQITDLGMTGLNAGNTRTAIGLAANLPQTSFRNTFQLQNNMSYTTGNHGWKFGVDVHRSQLHQLFKPTTRGHLVYTNLNNFVADIANVQINKDLPGVARVLHLDWHDFYLYGQDEWKVRPNLTLTLGLRYENAGQPIQDLVEFNDPVFAAANQDPRFRVRPIPGRDTNNWGPRIGFNWNPQTSNDGIMSFLTGGDKLVIRGGYTRTFDYAYTNIALNIWSSFPFVAAHNIPGASNAFANLNNLPVDPVNFTRTQVTDDFHSPVYDSFSFELQRELTRDTVVRVGYVGSKGTGLFESIDGNPVRFRTAVPTQANPAIRTDPTTGPIRLRANSGSSIYHSMQASVEKRLSRGVSAGVHFTWSSFIDSMSEIFNNSAAEIALAQDPYNRSLDRGRSSYDRPLRLAGNFVYELPFFSDQRGFTGRVLGGWQINSNFNFQSGAPFSPLNPNDISGTLGGLASAIGIATRPNVITNVDVSRMSVEELFALRGTVNSTTGNALFRALLPGERIGTAGRNILRADGLNNVDFGLVKNTDIGENQRIQLRVDFYNATNTRDFGTPNSIVTSPGFLRQWDTDGGNRRVFVGIRYVF